jgi:hypothetical protein
MLMSLILVCNATLFARTTLQKNNAFYARTIHIVFGNTSVETKIVSNIDLIPTMCFYII